MDLEFNSEIYLTSITMLGILFLIYALAWFWSKTIIIGNNDIGIAMWIKDTDGVIKYANKIAIDTIFRPAGCDNPVGLTFTHIFNDEVSALVRLIDAKALQSGVKAKMAVINFPTIGPMYVLKTITTTKGGEKVLRGFALPPDIVVELADLDFRGFGQY